MQLLLRVVVLALLGWQAVVASIELVQNTTNEAPPWSVRLGASTEERIDRVLGADAAIARALRAAVPAGSTVLNREAQGVTFDFGHVRDLEAKASQGDAAARRELGDLRETFTRLSAKNGLFVQLATLSFPDPFFVSVRDPIAAVEQEVAAGRDPWLFVLEGDPAPEGRPEWRCARREPRFALWRFKRN